MAEQAAATPYAEVQGLVISCTRINAPCADYEGAGSAGATLGFVFDTAAFAPARSGWHSFAALEASGIIAHDELIGERRASVHAGSGHRARKRSRHGSCSRCFGLAPMSVFAATRPCCKSVQAFAGRSSTVRRHCLHTTGTPSRDSRPPVELPSPSRMSKPVATFPTLNMFVEEIQMQSRRWITAFAMVLGATLTGCPKSDWKIHGGPNSCAAMCKAWGLEFTAMVGIGDQEDARGAGATACVCQPRHLVRTAAAEHGGASASASMSAPITAAAQAAAAAATHQQHQQSQQRQAQTAPGP